ncbi:hypothetical protein [Halopiger xanaduensis]|uniref:Uncharacterized protein n=1 Tax=Halopiger xanaduensis (strain DSM 18323 / JCM 14033 / SH-6) TaxID=797210 RepID=F8D784_HALXS|nr:hypothetical protein [Halopiger xanaduensis]AEH36650.1 hypothetical protein Halxa_2025 [Halopiger xanaduensis SH-6]
MSRSQRRLSLGLGLLFLATFAWSLRSSFSVILEEPGSLTSISLVAAGGLMLVGSAAFVLAGLSRQISIAGRTLAWWQVQSVGYVAIGLYLALSGLPRGSLSLVNIVMVVGGLGFAAFGYLQYRTEPTADAAAESV